MSAEATFAAAFAASFAAPLAKAYERRLLQRKPKDPTFLQPPAESFWLYSAIALLTFAAFVAAARHGGVVAITCALTLPTFIGTAILARAAKRLYLKLVPVGFEYRGIFSAPRTILWADISKVETDGGWFAVRTPHKRHLISRNVIGVVHFVSALQSQVARERFSDFAIKACEEITRGAAEVNAKRT